MLHLENFWLLLRYCITWNTKQHFGSIIQITLREKCPKYGVISGPYFPAFGLNTEIYFVSLLIQSECRKIRTRNNSVFGHFSRSDKPHKYGLSWKFLNDARFPYTYKSLYVDKSSSGNGPFYINATIDYVKYLVIQTKNQVNLKGRNISTDRLYTNIEASN